MAHVITDPVDGQPDTANSFEVDADDNQLVLRQQLPDGRDRTLVRLEMDSGQMLIHVFPEWSQSICATHVVKQKGRR